MNGQSSIAAERIHAEQGSLPYVYYGQPVCTICGDIGHDGNAAGSCNTPLCSSCGRRGHADANCSTACRECGRVHRKQGGTCTSDWCRICEMHGHTSPKCPVQQCDICKCRGHSRTECRACRLCAQHGHIAAHCPNQTTAQHSYGLPLDASSANGLAVQPILAQVARTSSSGSSYGQSNRLHADAPEFRPIVSAKSGSIALQDLPAGTVFAVGPVTVTLEAVPATKADEDSMRSALMDSLITRAEAYGLALLEDVQKQAALARLSAADLSKILIESCPEDLLDQFWQQYQMRQQQVHKQWQSVPEQRYYAALRQPQQLLQPQCVSTVQQQPVQQQQQQEHSSQAQQHQQQQQHRAVPGTQHDQQQSMQWQVRQSIATQQQQQQQASQQKVGPGDLTPEAAAVFEQSLPKDMLPPGWRTKYITWGLLQANVNMLAGGTTKQALQETTDKFKLAVQRAQAATLAVLTQPHQQQHSHVGTGSETHSEAHTVAAAREAALPHSAPRDAALPHSAPQQVSITSVSAKTLQQHTSAAAATAGHHSQVPTQHKGTASSGSKGGGGASGNSSNAANGGSGSSRSPRGSFQPANVPLRSGSSEKERTVWQQQLLDALRPKAAAYAAQLVKDEQKLSMLCRLYPFDLQAALQHSNPEKLLDQAYEHYVRTSEGAAKRGLLVQQQLQEQRKLQQQAKKLSPQQQQQAKHQQHQQPPRDQLSSFAMRPCDLAPQPSTDFAHELAAVLPNDWRQYESWSYLEDAAVQNGGAEAAFKRAKAAAVAGTFAVLEAAQHPDQRLQSGYDRHVLLSQTPYLGPCDLSPDIAAAFEGALPQGTLPADWRSYSSWRALDEAVKKTGARVSSKRYREARNKARVAAAEASIEGQQQQQPRQPQQQQQEPPPGPTNAEEQQQEQQSASRPGSSGSVGLNTAQAQIKLIGPCDLTDEAAAVLKQSLPEDMLPKDWQQFSKWGKLELKMCVRVGGREAEVVMANRKQYKEAVQRAQEATAAAMAAAEEPVAAQTTQQQDHASSSTAVQHQGSQAMQRKDSVGSSPLQASAPAFVPRTASTWAAPGSKHADNGPAAAIAPKATQQNGSSLSRAGSSSSSSTATRANSAAAVANSSKDGTSAAAVENGVHHASSAGASVQRRSSSGSGLASEAAADSSADPQYIPYGRPVCSKCGDEGHRRGSCNTPYCESCETYGHADGPHCVWACWKCGRHHRQLPAGAQCPNYRCFECGLFGHQLVQCPTVECSFCHRYGHKRVDCRACTECKQHGHKPRDCPGFCTRCNVAGHKTSDCRVVCCAQCGQVGHILGSGECPEQVGSRAASNRGKQKQHSKAASFDIKKLQLLPAATSQEVEDTRRQHLMNALLSKAADYAMQLLEGQEQKLAVLSRLSAADVEALLQQSRPGVLLDQLYEYHVQLATQANSQRGSSEIQQEQQQAAAQQVQEENSNSSRQRIVRPRDLPEPVASAFEQEFPVDALPSKWRSYDSWRELENIYADYVRRVGDWIGERRVHFRRERLKAQAATVQYPVTEQRRQEGWQGMPEQLPPPPQQQEQQQSASWGISPPQDYETWPAEQPPQRQEQDDSWPAELPPQQQQQQQRGQGVLTGQQQAGQAEVGMDQQQQLHQQAAHLLAQQMMMQHLQTGVPGIAPQHIAPPLLPPGLHQHILQQQRQRSIPSQPHMQVQQHLPSAKDASPEDDQRPPSHQMKIGPHMLTRDAAAMFAQLLPEGMLPDDWQRFKSWTDLEGNVSFTAGGRETAVHEMLRRFREAKQRAQAATEAVLLRNQQDIAATQQQRQPQQQVQQEPAPIAAPAAAYTQRPHVTVHYNAIQSIAQGQADKAEASAAARLQVPPGQGSYAGSSINGQQQHGGRATGSAEHDDEDDLGEMLGLLGV